MTPEQKTEKLMSPTEAAAMLRALADRLDKGKLEFGEVTVELDDSFSFKQTVKTKSDRVCFKLKLKYEKRLSPMGLAAPSPIHPVLERDQDEDDDDGAQPGSGPSYKRLKKSMGRAFKEIARTVETGGLPDLSLVKAFHAQCQTMTTFPGKGDEHYREFKARADRLLAVVDKGDPAEAAQASAALGAMKKACHAQYK